jgi:hypothetical protein
MTGNDGEIIMKKASEVLKGLRELDLPEADCQRIVKGRIDSGEVVDDLDTAALDVDELDAAVDAMKASLAGDYDADDPGSDLVAKGGGEDLFDMLHDGDGSIDLGDAFSAIAQADTAVTKGLNSLGYESRANHEVIAKGLMAVAKLMRDQTGVFKAQSEAIAQIQARQDQIAKAMALPIPPRSVLTGATAVPAPYEGETAKGGVDPAPAGDGEDLTAFAVMKAARAELQEITKGGRMMDVEHTHRAQELSSAIAKCESGGLTPREIAAQFNIRLAG